MKWLLKAGMSTTLVLMLAGGGVMQTGASTLSVTLSPEELLSGATVGVGQAYPITVSVTGDPDSSYDIQATSTGGIGACSSNTGSVATDGDGSGSWLCDFTAAPEPATGSITFTLSRDGAELGYLTGFLTVEAADEPAPEPTPDPVSEEDADGADNHGGCVSYWAHRAKAEGLRGKHFGGFVSAIAHSACTTTTREDARYVTMLADALQAQGDATVGRLARVDRPKEATARSGKDPKRDRKHGKP